MISAYLSRLGLPRESPSVEYLFALHRAHVSRVAYANLQIMRGAPTPIEPEESVRAILAGHGGYCFHLNGAFSWLLRQLGFSVTLHRGYVERLVQIGAPQLNHMALVVHDVQGGPWFVDGGLGDANYEPLPLRPGEFRQGPFTYRLAASSRRDGWHFTHDPRGSFAAMEFESAAARLDDFQAAHTRLSTSPDSSFVQFLTAQLRHADRIEGLRCCTLTTIDAVGRRNVHLDDRDTWVSTLAGFGLASDGLADLWPAARVTHEAWLASA